MQRPKMKLMLSGALATVMAFAAGAAAEGGNKADTRAPQQQHGTAAEQRSDVERTVGQKTGEASAPAASTEQVKDLQRQLAARGLYQGKIDGVAGAKTRAALRNFQSQQGIAATGELDSRSADALGIDLERQPVGGTDSAETAPAPASAAPKARATSDDIPSTIELAALSTDQARRVQQSLKDLGYYQGEVDGVVGPRTKTALTRYFQQQAQLAAQGKLSEPGMSSFGIRVNDVGRQAE
jgi:peptidoglycan hydrolase-like protein with peptidoglycan-binding domain